MMVCVSLLSSSLPLFWISALCVVVVFLFFFPESDPNLLLQHGAVSLTSPAGSLMPGPGVQSQPRLPRMCVILCPGPDQGRHPTEDPDSLHQSCQGRSTQVCRSPALISQRHRHKCTAGKLKKYLLLLK